MTRSLRASVVAVAAIAVGIALSGCGSDTKSEPTPSKQTSTESSATASKAAPTTSAQAAGPNKTIVDYIKENSITETPVHRGDPGSPTINLPFPPGWEDAGNRTPEWAYLAMLSSDPAVAQDPPTIIALVSKLTGNVDPAKILEFAPGRDQEPARLRGRNRRQPEHARRVRRDPDRRHLHQGRRQARHRPEDSGDPGPGRAVCAAAQRRWHRGPDGPVDGCDERHRRADHDHAVTVVRPRDRRGLGDLLGGRDAPRCSARTVRRPAVRSPPRR